MYYFLLLEQFCFVPRRRSWNAFDFRYWKWSFENLNEFVSRTLVAFLVYMGEYFVYGLDFFAAVKKKFVKVKFVTRH